VFRIKICGITSVADATTVARTGADAIGLNFYSKSPRCADLRRAEEVAMALPTGVRKIGLFVNSTAAEVVRVYEHLGLDVIQLHGDEPPEMLALLRPRPVIRAFRCGDAGFGPLFEYMNECRLHGYSPQAVLIDSYQPGRYGGTGQVTDWTRIPELRKELANIPVILAGGLRPENVAEAIRVARPTAVDTASGVESSPGVKDEDLVREFVNNATAAFDRLK